MISCFFFQLKRATKRKKKEKKKTPDAHSLFYNLEVETNPNTEGLKILDELLNNC